MWRYIKPCGEAIYSIAKPDPIWDDKGNPATWVNLSTTMSAGATKDANTIAQWTYSLQRRNDVYWYINNEYQVVQYDAEANSDITAEFLYDNEYSAYLNLSEMADDIFLSALSEMDIAAKIRARFFEYIKSKNQKP
jgi:hypothetical protein